MPCGLLRPDNLFDKTVKVRKSNAEGWPYLSALLVMFGVRFLRCRFPFFYTDSPCKDEMIILMAIAFR